MFAQQNIGLADALVIQAARAGDGGAFADLFARYSRFVTATIARYLGAGGTELGSSAEDVGQETWLVVSRKLDTYDPCRASFRSWICGIAATIARKFRSNYWKRRQRERIVGDFDDVPHPVTGGEQVEGESDVLLKDILVLLTENKAGLWRVPQVERRY